MELFLNNRADYTFKYNTSLGRHGWLRLTPAYSVKLVHALLKNSNPGERILDPFSGTGTTGLVAAEKGLDAVSFEINPFLIWLGNSKTRPYTLEEILELKKETALLLLRMTPDSKEYWKPALHNIERWWDEKTLSVLSKMRWLIADAFGEPSANNRANLVWIAFCRLAIETSAAAFNHVSMSFKTGTRRFEPDLIAMMFEAIFNFVSKSALSPLQGEAKVMEMDAKNPTISEQFDQIITSPPYPNRISYIRELRPYMYWTKFLHNGSDAGELDWKAIGGTWGIATSRLKNWQPANHSLPESLYDTCTEINTVNNANGHLMAQYVHKFFDDLTQHLQNIQPLLKPEAKLHYIIGNSSFYNVFVHTERIMPEILSKLGYSDITAVPIRKRNSKKGLFEFCISATWQ